MGRVTGENRDTLIEHAANYGGRYCERLFPALPPFVEHAREFTSIPSEQEGGALRGDSLERTVKQGARQRIKTLPAREIDSDVD